jgi:hypothetical protein
MPVFYLPYAVILGVYYDLYNVMNVLELDLILSSFKII